MKADVDAIRPGDIDLVSPDNFVSGVPYHFYGNRDEEVFP
jgi:hypothetical protein